MYPNTLLWMKFYSLWLSIPLLLCALYLSFLSTLMISSFYIFYRNDFLWLSSIWIWQYSISSWSDSNEHSINQSKSLVIAKDSLTYSFIELGPIELSLYDISICSVSELQIFNCILSRLEMVFFWYPHYKCCFEKDLPHSLLEGYDSDILFSAYYTLIRRNLLYRYPVSPCEV